MALHFVKSLTFRGHPLFLWCTRGRKCAFGAIIIRARPTSFRFRKGKRLCFFPPGKKHCKTQCIIAISSSFPKKRSFYLCVVLALRCLCSPPGRAHRAPALSELEVLGRARSAECTGVEIGQGSFSHPQNGLPGAELLEIKHSSACAETLRV